MVKEKVRQVLKREENITLEEMAEDIEMLIWQQGKSSFVLTEEFSGTKKRSLTVDSLSVEVEDGFVMLYDFNNLILKNEFVSMMFLDSYIQNITKQTVGDTTTYIITLPDGKITIK